MSNIFRRGPLPKTPKLAKIHGFTRFSTFEASIIVIAEFVHIYPVTQLYRIPKDLPIGIKVWPPVTEIGVVKQPLRFCA